MYTIGNCDVRVIKLVSLLHGDTVVGLPFCRVSTNALNDAMNISGISFTPS